MVIDYLIYLKIITYCFDYKYSIFNLFFAFIIENYVFLKKVYHCFLNSLKDD